MTADKNPDYGKFRSKWVRSLLKTPAPAVALHWVFQSLFYMDPTERWFKISLDVLLTAIIAIFFRSSQAPMPALAAAFILAHTINFLFNGHLWGVLKQYGLVHTSPQYFERYVLGLIHRSQKEPSIRNLYVYGSLARQEWSSMSDLDVRLVRQPGFVKGVRACWFVLSERSRALIARFPIDIYVLDQMSNLKKLRFDESAMNITELEHFRLILPPPSEANNR